MSGTYMDPKSVIYIYKKSPRLTHAEGTSQRDKDKDVWGANTRKNIGQEELHFYM